MVSMSLSGPWRRNARWWGIVKALETVLPLFASITCLHPNSSGAFCSEVGDRRNNKKNPTHRAIHSEQPSVENSRPTDQSENAVARMNIAAVHSVIAEAGRRRQAWRRSTSSSDASSARSSNPSTTSEKSDADLRSEATPTLTMLSDQELLQRARAAHANADFASLAAGPEANGPWQRVEAVDRFVVFRRQLSADDKAKGVTGLDVMCAGRIDASLEELASIFRSSSEGEHNAAMAAMYTKSFIFGSFERDVPCSRDQNQHGHDGGLEQLAVKTKSFARTSILGRNEQWCYVDYFQRKKERDGFTITKRALLPRETTPGRITGEKAQVDQLHGLNASYLVDKLPGRQGLRVVFRAWFEDPESDQTRSLSSAQSGLSHCSRLQGANSSFRVALSSRLKSLDRADSSKQQARIRRLLAMAHGLTKLATLVRRRRFGVQIPADLGAVRASNSRCPCCTRSLDHVRLSLSKAATAFATRSLASLKTDTRHCYLCGYRVCIDCWSSDQMESVAGRVAAIIVCARCRANVQACEYSEVFAGSAEERKRHRGPPRVVEDSNKAPTASLLVDFLSTSLLNTSAGSPEHAALVTVIRTLLGQSGGNDNPEDEHDAGCEWSSKAVEEVGEIFSEERLPPLETCKLGNAEQRDYHLDLPEDPTLDVPRYPIPSNEVERLAAAEAAGLLQFADRFAPDASTSTNQQEPMPAMHDLDLLCHLAAKTLDCGFAFIAVMGPTHEHFLAENRPLLAGTTAPREHTTCQHALMSPLPLMAVHHEADVRLHKADTTRSLHIRSYVGFPLAIEKDGEQLTVGMFCCLDSKPRAEITRGQYAVMQRLARAATTLLLHKAAEM
jgi:hypothetical protein